MINKKLTLLTVFALAVATSASSYATTVKLVSAGDKIRIRFVGVNYRQGNGGEFQMDRQPQSTGTWLNNYSHVYCAERSETISNNEIVCVKSVGLTAVASGNTLSLGAARMYRDYAEAIAARSDGYNTVGTPSNNFTLAAGAVTFRLGGSDAERAADGEAFQKALWKLLGESINLTGKAATLYNYYSGTDFSGDADAANFFHVRIANLVNADTGNNRQDQMILIPEPGSVLIWGSLLGLASVGFYRRWGHSQRTSSKS